MTLINFAIVRISQTLRNYYLVNLLIKRKLLEIQLIQKEGFQ
jgi:hypothetical protein